MPETNETIVAGYRSMKRIRIVNIRFLQKIQEWKPWIYFNTQSQKRWIRSHLLHPGCVREHWMRWWDSSTS